MNLNEAKWYITALVTILGTSGFAALINWFKDRKKDKISAEAESVHILKDVIVELRAELVRLQDQIKSLETRSLENRERSIQNEKDILASHHCEHCQLLEKKSNDEGFEYW